MTAQVAILNSEGVALATDSAATVEGSRGVKIYNTVNKLFTLSKYHPVAIMVYSSAEVMGVPVETVIKWFRANEIGSQELDTVDAYATKFQRFLESNLDLFPLEARRRQCVRVVRYKIDCIRQLMQARLYGLIPRKLPATKAFNLARNGVLADLEAAHANKAEVPNVPDITREFLKDLIERTCLNTLKRALFIDATNPEIDEDRTKAILFDLLFKDVDEEIEGTWFGGGETGFVVAGFGKTEFFPHLRSFEFVWSYEGGNCVRIGENADIGLGANEKMADVRSFAQHEMVDSFMEGRVPELDEIISGSIKSFFDDMATAIKDNGVLDKRTKTKQTKELDQIRADLVDHVGNAIGRWSAESHKDPMFEAIQALPKEGLAVIAEALVDLTITKRRASPDAETVGPPTDVAVISKGDGFIWIKRKHYFKPELNPYFIKNYFREGNQE